MSEDYTYEPVTPITARAGDTVAALRAECDNWRELAANANEGLRLANGEIARLQAMVDAVPDYANYYVMAVHASQAGGDAPMTLYEWCAAAALMALADIDDDGPLTLADIDDEDGDL